MRDLVWRLGCTVMALLLVVLLAGSGPCCAGHQFVEILTGQTPNAQLSRYLAAIAQGDRASALALWQSPHPGDGDMVQRRQVMTEQLLEFGPSLRYQIVDRVWWTTCCMPGITDDPGSAGGVQIKASLSSREGQEQIYVFCLRVPGTYWGAAGGYRLRRWVLVDVYPVQDRALAWPWMAH